MNTKSAEFVIGVASPSQLPRTAYPEIAWAGRSNVGKSSLINRLIARKNLARTSNTPGKTRQINFYLISKSWYLVDLPGYGFARGPAAEREGWGELIEPYLAQRRQIAGVAVLVDARVGVSPLDEMMFSWLSEHDRPWAIMLTKIDRVSGNDRVKTERALREILPDGVPVFSCSAKTGRGIEAVRSWVDKRVAEHSEQSDGLLDWQLSARDNAGTGRDT